MVEIVAVPRRSFWKVIWGSSRRWRPLLIAILVGVLLPLVFAAVSGNLAIPHNDAWSYSRIAEIFGRTGQIKLLDWNRSALIGQILILGPLAQSIVTQQVYVAVLSAVLLFCVYALFLRFTTPFRAGIVVCAIACWPGYALLTTSFMSDIPAMAAAFLALYLCVRAVERDSILLFALAMLAGLWSCTIRLQGIAAPVAVLLYVFFVKGGELRRLRRWLVALFAIAFVAIFTAFTMWRNSFPNGDEVSFSLAHNPLNTFLLDGIGGYFELALVVGPIALAFSRPWQWRVRSWSLAFATAFVGWLAWQQLGGNKFFLQNYLSPSGAYWDVIEPQPIKPVFNEIIWAIVVIFSIAMGGILAGTLAERGGGRRGERGGEHSGQRFSSVLAIFAILTIIGTLATGAVDQQVFGRYFIPIAPWLLAIIITPPATARHGTGARTLVDRLGRVILLPLGSITLIFTFALSSALTANAFAFDRARWTAAEIQARKVPASRVDSGLEWLGWHSAKGVVDRYPKRGWGFEGMFSKQVSCVVITPQRIKKAPPAWRVVGTYKYAQFLVVGSAKLYIYDTYQEGCNQKQPTDTAAPAATEAPTPAPDAPNTPDATHDPAAAG